MCLFGCRTLFLYLAVCEQTLQSWEELGTVWVTLALLVGSSCFVHDAGDSDWLLATAPGPVTSKHIQAGRALELGAHHEGPSITSECRLQTIAASLKPSRE